MRIVQLIDSLDIGGAEKMAVNYANALSEKIEFSGLVTSRKEGELKNQINKSVEYLYLKKNRTFDSKAIIKLKNYCKKNKVDLIHAHSSSYFLAVLVKLIYPQIKIIWHHHSECLKKNDIYALKICSIFFHGIIVVKKDLIHWVKNNLYNKNCIQINNFTFSNTIQNEKQTHLNGLNGKRITSVANLRVQKNHFFLLEIAELVNNEFPDWTFHLIGKDYNDEYSSRLKEDIRNKKLENIVHIYNSKTDISNILNQTDIGIITSSTEGLPVALIEYGINSIPIVTTDVGEIPNIIENNSNGYIVAKDDLSEFYNSLKNLILNKENRSIFGKSLNHTINKLYSSEININFYLSWLKQLNNPNEK